jgi:hypothetical protein
MMNARYRRSALLVACALFFVLLAQPALAVYGAEWFWTTEGDQNPVTYQDCLQRAPGALATTGVASGRNGNFFYVDSPNFHVVLLCINRPHGMNMVLEVAVAGGSLSGSQIGNAINDAFWQRGGAGGSNPPSNGGWVIDVFGCGAYLGPHLTTALTQAANGTVSGQLFGKFDNARKADVDPANSSAGNGMIHILAHPDGWASNLEFTGQWDGSKFAGKMHHYTSDDCTFTMTRG